MSDLTASVPASRPPLSRDPTTDFLVVIPTCGDPSILVPTVRRVLEHAEPRTVLCLSVNPIDAAKADEAIAECSRLPNPNGVAFAVWRETGPVGFARAVNGGLRMIEGSSGLGALNVILNDDTRVTAGWLRGLQAAVDSPTVRVPAEPPVGPGSTRADRDATAYGRIGLVGPVSDRVAGMQAVNLPEGALANLDAFAAQHRLHAAGEVLTADFLSGFCVGVKFEALYDLVEWEFTKSLPVVDPWNPDALAEQGASYYRRWSLFDERFAIGGFEDNDLCVRAELAGWRCAVAGDVFVQHLGHQTLDRYPGQMRGMANRLTYYQKWSADPRASGKRLVAAYRVKIETVQDIHYFRTSLARLATICDGVAVVLTNNPLDIQDSDDFQDVKGLPESDQRFLQACSNADASGIEAALLAWIQRTWAAVPGARPLSARTSVWTGAFNEREERNALLALAESASADWILSVDHDEVLEPRVDRGTFERLMSHPDPLVRAWDFGWVNHWDSMRLVRQDQPWGDGGTFRGGMRGFRMFRVCRAAPRRVLSGNAIGLHCGNVPMHDPIACRVSGVRFRHYGYLRVNDRFRKHRRYTTIDPKPDAALTGGGYGHLVAEEGMRLAPFVAQDGIGLSMLVHGGEKAEDVARHLDVLHGLVDRAVLVWTGDLPYGQDETWTLEDSGVHPDVAAFARIFDARVILRPLDDHFAAARNAGLDALRPYAEPKGNRPPTMGWLLSLDPDEHLQDWFSDAVALRRMAECSDAYGFMFRFANLRPADTGEAPTMSETIRLIRLDPNGVMRWKGRVHEGFDAALSTLLQMGERPMLRTAPFVVINPGLGGDDLALERKTRFYQRLLLKELDENWDNAGAWVALGMQYANDGHHGKATECYQRAALCSGEGYRPHRELGMQHLRVARAFFANVARLVHQGHPQHGFAVEALRWLDVNAPEQPLVGLARRGQAPADSDVPLPWHPGADGPRVDPNKSITEHPLSVALGPEWRWLSGSDWYTTLLHPSGAYTRISAKMQAEVGHEADWSAVATALQEAVARGDTGEIVVTVPVRYLEDGGHVSTAVAKAADSEAE
jgi:GT2 family glycosyltransferase